MKFSITFKSPDGVYSSISEAVDDECIPHDDDHYDKTSELRQELENFVETWVSYGEYVTIDFDTEAGTALVRKS